MTTQLGGVPATMGRRVGARAIDFSIGMLFAVVLNLSAASVLMNGGDGGGILIAMFVLVGAYGVFGFWAVFARAALPGQLMLGLYHVDARTGRRAGGNTFLKYLVQSCTFGLALVITPLSIQAPNRSWFDRLVGVSLLDGRYAAVDNSPVRVEAPPDGWQAEESQLTQAGLPEPAAPPVQQGRTALIQTVPFTSGLPSHGHQALPAVARPVGAPVAPPVQQPVQPVAPMPGAAPTTASAAVEAPVVMVLDDGRRIPVTGVLLFGRSPRPSAAMRDAQVVPVDDRSVSANHVAVGVDQDGPWVMDLRSSNGSWLQQGGAAEQRLEPMQRVALSAGAVLRVGKCRMTVVPA